MDYDGGFAYNIGKCNALVAELRAVLVRLEPAQNQR